MSKKVKILSSETNKKDRNVASEIEKLKIVKKKKTTVATNQETPIKDVDESLSGSYEYAESDKNSESREEESAESVEISYYIGYSGCSLDAKQIIFSAVDGIPGAEISAGPEVTHLILESNKRTFKVLSAIAHGAWVLDPSWIYTCIENRKWMPEEDFESPFFEGIRKSRVLHQKESFQGILHDFKIHIGLVAEEISDTIQDLIHACGGEISNKEDCQVAILSNPLSPEDKTTFNSSVKVVHIRVRFGTFALI